SSEELSGSLRERTILQFERDGQLGIPVVAGHSISDIVAEHDPVFVAMTRENRRNPGRTKLKVRATQRRKERREGSPQSETGGRGAPRGERTATPVAPPAPSDEPR